jgi:hypothetical protein
VERNEMILAPGCGCPDCYCLQPKKVETSYCIVTLYPKDFVSFNSTYEWYAGPEVIPSSCDYMVATLDFETPTGEHITSEETFDNPYYDIANIMNGGTIDQGPTEAQRYLDSGDWR